MGSGSVERHQKLPSSGPERESLRQKGQFWTPRWVAEAMVAYAIGNGSDHIFDPAVGEGAFLRAAKRVAKESGRDIMLLGTEIDHNALGQALESGLTELDLANVQQRDFVLQPPEGFYKAIVGNPPYIRHHRLPVEIKDKLKALGTELLGKPLDGRAGLHIYFLLRALRMLNEDGRLAFIMPADTCEGVFAPRLWNWITANYRLDAVVAFAPDASPFPGVDTNPLIFMISKGAPKEYFSWVRCMKANTYELYSGVASKYSDGAYEALNAHRRSVREALTTGLSREPLRDTQEGPILSDFARVLRGIATGANEYFFLTEQQATNLGIDEAFLKPAIGRTRDLTGDAITAETMNKLAGKGRPTLLFSPDGRALGEFDAPTRKYLELGEKLGINKGSLITQRRPWYKMEKRNIPPFLFAYLGRRSVRFVRNYVGVMPLTGFLCVYPHSQDPLEIEKLWEVLQHPETVANLTLVGKSYGDGAIKVEPRALERLPLPAAVVAEFGLDANRHKQTANKAELVQYSFVTP